MPGRRGIAEKRLVGREEDEEDELEVVRARPVVFALGAEAFFGAELPDAAIEGLQCVFERGTTVQAVGDGRVLVAVDKGIDLRLDLVVLLIEPEFVGPPTGQHASLCKSLVPAVHVKRASSEEEIEDEVDFSRAFLEETRACEEVSRPGHDLVLSVTASFDRPSARLH